MATKKSRKDELLDELLAETGGEPEAIIGENGLLKQLTQRLLERALDGELTHHLGYEKHAAEGAGTGNSRNGKSRKKIRTDHGDLQIEVPRDRNGEFEPRIIGKNQTRFEGLDDKIISMYSRGMTTRDISTHLKELYGVDVSADFISQVTNAVTQEVTEWQNRPLDPVYAIVYLDAIMCKIRDEGHIKNKAVYLAVGVNFEGKKDVLGLWIQETEGAKFWLSVLTDLKNRGVEDILIACVDGLKGFPEAIESTFPKAQVQLCIVHMVRNSMKFVSWKDRRQVARDLKQVYRAPTEKKAEQALEAFESRWGQKYASIPKLWRRHWERITPFLAYPAEIRRVIYTTNAIESLNDTLRKVTKTRRSFPSDESCTKILYLAIRNLTQRWNRPLQNWGAAVNQLMITFGDRVPVG